MIGYLRFFGVINVAVWLGSTLFYLLAAGPAFRSPEMTQLLGPVYSGAAAHVMVERYFALQYWCGALALLHLSAEMLYTGRKLQSGTLYLVVGLLAVALVGGFWVQPKMQQLHLTIHGIRSTPAEVITAQNSFSTWQGLGRLMHLVIVGGLLIFLWQITDPTDMPRLVRTNKFRA